MDVAMLNFVEIRDSNIADKNENPPQFGELWPLNGPLLIGGVTCEQTFHM